IQLHGARWASEPKDDLVANLPFLVARLETDRENDAEARAAAAESSRQREAALAASAIEAKRVEREAAAFSEFAAMVGRHREANDAREFLAKLEAGVTGAEQDDLLQWLREKIEAQDPLTRGAA